MGGGPSWVQGLGWGIGLVGIPEHHFRLHRLQQGVTAIGIGTGLLVKLRHPLHVQIVRLELHEAALQSCLGLAVAELVWASPILGGG